MTVSKATKKPIKIEYMRLEAAGSVEAIIRWVHEAGGSASTEPRAYLDWIVKIDTPEGGMVVNFGDVVIRDAAGEFHPCRGDIFDAIYALAEKGKADTGDVVAPIEALSDYG